MYLGQDLPVRAIRRFLRNTRYSIFMKKYDTSPRMNNMNKTLIIPVAILIASTKPFYRLTSSRLVSFHDIDLVVKNDVNRWSCRIKATHVDWVDFRGNRTICRLVHLKIKIHWRIPRPPERALLLEKAERRGLVLVTIKSDLLPRISSSGNDRSELKKCALVNNS